MPEAKTRTESEFAELLGFALDTITIMDEHLKRRPPCEHCLHIISQVKNRWEKKQEQHGNGV